ncbi:hypothetical protein BDY19DRAFT_1057706 [Irpex rosettiformis]|uniref:Uncharacterized protein n=1 Tax=Irpex rosettiformis TaxID=378272 RepID=A0ACB8U1A7_9APHY|nr:hypothetical protein BDY19DRAFT_1057706 [Irpex rosettiformis]
MRVAITPLLLAGASLVTLAQASPIRVVVVSGQNDVSRFTKIQVSNGATFRPEIFPHGAMIPVPNAQGQQGRSHHLCQKLKNKALEISNKFRETFGLPLIEKHPENLVIPPPIPLQYMPLPPPMKHGEVKILPIMNAMPVTSHAPKSTEPHPVHPVDVMEGHPGHGMRHHSHGGCRRSFVHRLHRALMVLGPWEGRAVAFVLGCGIGVLLRMFWVMAIVIARSFRGRSSSDDDGVEHILVFERDAEDIFVPPPEYTDEKVALVVEDKKADNTA